MTGPFGRVERAKHSTPSSPGTEYTLQTRGTIFLLACSLAVLQSETIGIVIACEQFLQGLLGQTPKKSGEGNPDPVVDQDQQYKMTLKIEGKADRTAKVYKFTCPLFRLDKTSLHQELEKLSENRINGYGI